MSSRGRPQGGSGGAFLTEVSSQAAVREPSPLLQTKAAIKDAKTKATKVKNDFINKHCQSHVSEEWQKVDDKKISKLRGILAALQEENQSTQLLKKESDNRAAKQELDATRSSVQVRSAAVKDKEATFQARKADLQAHVQENEKALHDQEMTIEKSEKKAKDEQAECRRLDKEIEALQAEYKDHENTQEDLLKKIELFAKYKKFLEMVVHEQLEIQGDVEDLINRHNTLESGHGELFQANATLSKTHDARRDECQRVQTLLQNEHLRISSQLHECQVNLARHKDVSQDLDKVLIQALEKKKDKESEVGVIQMAIDQLFSRTLASFKLNPNKNNSRAAVESKFQPVLGDKNDVQLDDMLRQIVERLEDLGEILQKSDAELKPKNVEETQIVEEVELKVEFKVCQASDGMGMNHRDHAGNSAQLTAGSSQRRLQSDTSGTISRPEDVPVP